MPTDLRPITNKMKHHDKLIFSQAVAGIFHVTWRDRSFTVGRPAYSYRTAQAVISKKYIYIELPKYTHVR